MNISVFIADDHAVVCDGLKYMLNAQDNITVIGCANNGRDAVRRIVRLNPNIALIDIGMPLLNGIEATREICTVCSSTRVIILSMFSTSEHIFRAFEAGAWGYLLKESTGNELIKAICDVLAGHRYLSQRISDFLVDDYVYQRQANTQKSPLNRLSHREREVLQLVVDGNSTTAIAKALCLSPKTVGTYRSRLMNKLGIDDLPALVKFAIQHGVTSLQ